MPEQAQPARRLVGESSTYEPAEGFVDELFAGPGAPREHADDLVSTLDGIGRLSMVDLGRRRDEIFRQQGITFAITGPDGSVRDRPFPLDLVPRIIPAAEWDEIERGLAQRLRALNSFIDDIYHGREIVREGIVPWQLVLGSPQFRRAVHGVRPPGGIYCHVAGCDLVRDADGRWRVLEDNCRTPSGISYVLENRLAMTRLAPELFTGYRVRPVDDYPQLLLSALREVAPAPGRDADGRRLDPGPGELGLLRALVPRPPDGGRAGRGERPRGPRRHRLHADDRGAGARRRDLSPARRRLHRPARVPARLAARGPRSDPRLPRRHRRARQCRRHRGRRRQGGLQLRPRDDPLLPRRGAAARQRADLSARATPSSASTRSRGSASWWSSRPTSRAARACSSARRRPRRSSSARSGWCSRRPSAGSPRSSSASQPPRRSPRMARWRPRHVDLRPFAVYGSELRIVPGGLTRVALAEGSMIVNSSRGGGSKDTWVLSDGRPEAVPGSFDPSADAARDAGDPALELDRPGATATAGSNGAPRALMLARIAHELYWIGRYVARADDTARMLDGLFRASLQSPGRARRARASRGRP